MFLRDMGVVNVLKGAYTMKKALIIANMLFASVTVFGMNVSLADKKNNIAAFIEVKDLTEHEQNIRKYVAEQIHECSRSTRFEEVNNSFEAAKSILISSNILELLLSYRNKKPLTDKQIKGLMVSSRILNSVDQNEDTLLSYTIKEFLGMTGIGGGDGWDASWNREKLILLSTFMIEHGADPTLKMADNMEHVKRYADWWMDEAEAFKKLLNAYEKATTKESEAVKFQKAEAEGSTQYIRE